jgi:hypothetical protein
MLRFHENYKKWILSQPQFTEDDWKVLIEEDSQHPYDQHPTSQPQPPISPVIGDTSPEWRDSQDNNNYDPITDDHVQGNYIEIGDDGHE